MRLVLAAALWVFSVTSAAAEICDKSYPSWNYRAGPLSSVDEFWVQLNHPFVWVGLSVLVLLSLKWTRTSLAILGVGLCYLAWVSNSGGLGYNDLHVAAIQEGCRGKPLLSTTAFAGLAISSFVGAAFRYVPGKKPIVGLIAFPALFVAVFLTHDWWQRSGQWYYSHGLEREFSLSKDYLSWSMSPTTKSQFDPIFNGRDFVEAETLIKTAGFSCSQDARRYECHRRVRGPRYCDGIWSILLIRNEHGSMVQRYAVSKETSCLRLEFNGIQSPYFPPSDKVT